MKKQDIRNYIEEGILLEQLEEIGKIDVDFIENEIDLDLLVKVLYEEYNLNCEYENLVGGYYLVNEQF